MIFISYSKPAWAQTYNRLWKQFYKESDWQWPQALSEDQAPWVFPHFNVSEDGQSKPPLLYIFLLVGIGLLPFIHDCKSCCNALYR